MLLLRRLAGAARPRGVAGRGLASGTSGAPREAADAVVVGAGVVGLAAARALAMAGREVVVVEAAPSFGTGTSSRNSEVIHAGIYYPPRSLKATLCVRGKEMLYKYCEERGVAHKRISKLIVATGAAEVPKLDMLLRNAKENGVDLQLMEGSEAMEMEPELQCLKALLSPSTGIIDSHSLMLSLLADAENLGTTISYNTAVISAHVGSEGIELHVCESKELQSYHVGSHVNAQLVLLPKLVINSAGLSAVPLAKQFCGLDQAFVPTPHYARGCYFTLSQSKSPFRRLIYPLPEDGGIGVHVTIDMNGLVRFGPDVEWISDGGKDHVSCFLNKFDYSVNPNRCSVFYPVVRKYFPNLKDGSLEPGYSGIRPKLSGPGQPPSDFVIQGWDVHGIPGLVNLFGIESPGLTSSLAIAEHIVSKYL